MELRRIMVAVKPWERGLPIGANHARQIAQSADAEIEIVSSVFDAGISAGRDRGDELAHKAHSRTVAEARAGLERLASSMRAWRARVTTRIVWGVPPYEAILAAAQDWHADLLVVGAHEPGTLNTRLTDTDWQLMRRVRCPLLLVKGAAFCGYRAIFTAVDPYRGESAELDRAVLAASRCVARACGSTEQAVYPYPHQGSPAQAIVTAAAHARAELVVVGAPQRCGTAVAGNIAELVAGEVPCDVLIVPRAEVAPIAAGSLSKVG